MGKVFPKQNPAQVQDAITFFDRTGDADALRRASLQNLEDRALATDRNIDASKRYVDFYRLEREMGPGTGWGNSTEAMLGPGAAGEVNDVVRVGKALGAPARNFGNTSRTTHVAHALSAAGALAGGLLHPATLPWTLGIGLGLPYAAGKAMASPRVAKWLTAPLEALPAAPAGVADAIGTAVRIPAAMKRDDLDELRDLPVDKKSWFDLNAPPDVNASWFDKNKPPE